MEEIDVGAYELITPHGDRKLDHLVVEGLWTIILITPHGDRKPRESGPSGKWNMVSLPLMGIGNTSPVGMKVRLSPVSLPLMGIGNLLTAAAFTSSCPSHYPSWGSETFLPHKTSACFPGLITPHGDRKLANEPFHGGADPSLITPHGDRKPLLSADFFAWMFYGIR